jgi:hypothetical protein
MEGFNLVPCTAQLVATEGTDVCSESCIELEALLQVRRSLGAAAPQDPRIEQARRMPIERELKGAASDCKAMAMNVVARARAAAAGTDLESIP